MGNVVMHNVVSVDGFIADENDQVGPLFEWYVNGEYGLAEDRQDATGRLKVSKASIDYVRPTWAGIGSMVIGRHLFDMTNGWEGLPPTGEHVVVVSHRPKPDGWHPEASYHFIDDVAAAVAKAKALAGEGTVAVAAGDVGGQVLALGLVDEVAMDVVPVLEAENRRLRESVTKQREAAKEQGFGARAEKLLQLAESEAAELRSRTVRESADLMEQSRAAAEGYRHEAEQALIVRTTELDQLAARRDADPAGARGTDRG